MLNLNAKEVNRNYCDQWKYVLIKDRKLIPNL